MHNLPRPMQEVVSHLSSLPGIGPKSALRIALALLQMSKERAVSVGESILSLREEMYFCTECASLAESDPCPLCSSEERSATELCVVSDWDSFLAFEQMGAFNGKYLVLGGLLSPIDGINADQLEFQRLYKRLEQGQITELLLALGSTTDAENTALYIRSMVEKRYPHIQISRLAQGIPVGAELKFMDKETLRQSLEYRRDFK